MRPTATRPSIGPTGGKTGTTSCLTCRTNGNGKAAAHSFFASAAGRHSDPSGLAPLFSDNEKNQAIQRGLWIRTKLLGGTVPTCRFGVDAQLPSDPKLTLREEDASHSAGVLLEVPPKDGPAGPAVRAI